LVNLCDIGTILGLLCILPMYLSMLWWNLPKTRMFLCVIVLQLLKFTKLIYTKCKLIQPLHFNLKIFLNSQML
jgi:hypothetical protein